MKVSKWEDKLKESHQRIWPFFERDLYWYFFLPKKLQTTKQWLWFHGGWQPWCSLFVIKHQHSTKAWETPVHEPQEQGQRNKRSVKCGFSIPKHPLFTLQSLSWLSLHSLTTTLSLHSVGDCMSRKANTSVISVLFWEALDDGCWDGVDEPQWATSQPQHPPCVPSCFSLTVLSILIHPPHKWCLCDGLSNGVLSHSTNVMCHPLLYLSPTQSHHHSCLLIATDTHHVGYVIRANPKHPDIATVNVIQCPRTRLRCTVCWMWLACMATIWMMIGMMTPQTQQSFLEGTLSQQSFRRRKDTWCDMAHSVVCMQVRVRWVLSLKDKR